MLFLLVGFAHTQYDELVAVVHATGDTSLTCHSIMEDTIFDLIANQSTDGGSEGATLMDTKEVALPPMPKDCAGEPLGMPAIVLVPVGGGRSVAYALDDDPTPESTVHLTTFDFLNLATALLVTISLVLLSIS